ncbi:hypothetical protein EUGRSUZ_D02117 [Eucalyptus grandis]|uniref:Fungal lipase-type domain-containing protein n=2 Tax=Eucalyptus grandis TaxID=71139 RepID=A0A059CHU7_EUCGR|nr:hypothetical protein EUGRSUZ_D02117 [Eucalyptus grandis]
MAIGAINLHMFQTACGGASFKRRLSSLNPSASSAAAAVRPITSTESARKQLANLDRVLQKESTPALSLPQGPQKPASEPDFGFGTSSSSSKKRGRGLLQRLNLSRIWPEIKAAAEEMSPRRLGRLRRLLSKNPEYSPRNGLGSRWRQYHGCDDWGGLLDPLDENLRREMIRYGELVQAAYQAFNSNPAMPTEEAPMPHHVALPDKSYKVTKSLYATSAVGLPKWVDDVAPDLGWLTQRSSWVGYVAVCDDRREIQRMGRRDVVIALRGTATCLEWAENFRTKLAPISSTEDPKSKVGSGFLSLFKTPGAHVPSLAESVVEEVQRLMELYKGETLSITITGHSLGAALALLVADELTTRVAELPSLAVFSFGGPRVGNSAFADRIRSKNVKVLRIVNDQDVITRVPGMFLSDDLERKLKETVDGMLENGQMPWDSYSHAGTELRLDTRKSPYLKPNADVACCHDLEAYLHLVDGFMASNCPFRANAKRSLVKLLNEQRTNVKKLYTSKANALTLNVERGQIRPPNMASCLPSPS